MKKKILVIEDERSTRTNILQFLEVEGFDALGAENGRSGIELAKKHLPELIICDILMPELDGYDVLTNLQQDPKTAAIPFIFLTVTTDKDSFRHGMELGADDYLSKPVTSAQLRRAIASRLKRQEATVRRYSTDAIEIEGLQAKVAQLERYIEAKDTLSNNLSQSMREPLVQIREIIEQLKSEPSAPERDRYLEILQEKFARILALVNQLSELQRLLKPENANLLDRFNFLDT